MLRFFFELCVIAIVDASVAIVGTGTPESCTDGALGVAWAEVESGQSNVVEFRCGVAGTRTTIKVSKYRNTKSSVTLRVDTAAHAFVTLDGRGKHRIFSFGDMSYLPKMGRIIANRRKFTIEGLGFSNGHAQAGGEWETHAGGGCLAIGYGALVSIRDASFRACSAEAVGGAIFAEAAVFTVENSLFEDNQAKIGGGALDISIASKDNTSLTIKSTTFRNNRATDFPAIKEDFNNGGGAVRARCSLKGCNGLMTIDTVLAEGNSGGCGGAFNVRKLPIKATCLTFRNNIAFGNVRLSGKPTAAVGGGAMYFSSAGPIELTHSSFTDNIGKQGGAILNDNGNLNIYDTVFEGNRAVSKMTGLANWDNAENGWTAGGHGGAILQELWEPPGSEEGPDPRDFTYKYVRVLFLNNEAQHTGGAITTGMNGENTPYHTLSWRDCYFCGNTIIADADDGGQKGAAVIQNRGRMRFEDCVVSGNTIPTRADEWSIVAHTNPASEDFVRTAIPGRNGAAIPGAMCSAPQIKGSKLLQCGWNPSSGYHSTTTTPPPTTPTTLPLVTTTPLPSNPTDFHCDAQAGKNAAYNLAGVPSDWEKTSTANECQTLCLATGNCAVWTWHNAEFKTWAGKCVTWSSAQAKSFGRFDPDTWVGEGRVTSGICRPTTITTAPPPLTTPTPPSTTAAPPPSTPAATTITTAATTLTTEPPPLTTATPPSTTATPLPCEVHVGKNAAHSLAGSASDWQKTSTASECQTLCLDTVNCAVWTWHSASFNTWAEECVTWSSAQAKSFGRFDPDAWVDEAGMTSGNCGITTITPSPPLLTTPTSTPTATTITRRRRRRRRRGSTLLQTDSSFKKVALMGGTDSDVKKVVLKGGKLMHAILSSDGEIQISTD